MGKLNQLAFYPTLFYNVARNYVNPNYAWFNHVDETIILGALPFKNMINDLVTKEKVGGVVCMNEHHEIDHDWVAKKDDWEAMGVRFYWLPTPDFFYSRPFADIQFAVDFIKEFEGSGKKVYIHCKAGRTRSATVAACYLMQKHKIDTEAALNRLRLKRHQVLLREAHIS